jgi:hypothetical protein
VKEEDVSFRNRFHKVFLRIYRWKSVRRHGMYKRQLIDTWIVRLILVVTVILMSRLLLYDLQKENSSKRNEEKHVRCVHEKGRYLSVIFVSNGLGRNQI